MERNRMLGTAVALAAAGAIIGAAAGGGWLWLHYVCKPLTTVLVLCTAVWGEGVVPRYQRWVVAGLLLSLAGDVFLMLPGDFFVPGLVAFLLAHVCYIAAFIPGVRLLRSPGIGLVLVAYGAANVLALWRYLENALRAPVVVYLLVLATMVWVALARWRQMPAGIAGRGAAGSAALGAVLFISSDTLLAWDRFAGAVPLPALGILATYFLAQWCIARSVSAGANAPR